MTIAHCKLWLNIKFSILRRQKDVDKWKKECGINEDDVNKYFESEFARKADRDFKLSATRLKLKPTRELHLMRDHLVLSLLLDNVGRNSEVNCG